MISSPPRVTLPPAAFFVRDAGAALWRRRFLAFFLFAGTVLLILFGIMLTPRTYQSEAKLFVRLGRESVGLDPTATTGQTISVNEPRESELNSVMDVLSSRVILENVVERIGAETILKGYDPADPEQVAEAKQASEGPLAKVKSLKSTASHTLQEFTTSIGLSDPIGAREKAVLALSKTLSVTSTKKSTVISITCKAATPKLAQRIVEEAIAAFQAKHLEVNRTKGSHEFFVEQARLTDENYQQAAEALKLARNELGLASVEGKRSQLQVQMATLESELLDTSKLMAVTEASLRSTRGMIETLPGTIHSQSVAGSPNSVADRVRQQIADLRLREQTLLTRYTSENPLIKSLRKQITQAESFLDGLGSDSMQQTEMLNPALQQLEMQAIGDETQLEALAARKTTLINQVEETRADLRELNSHEGELAALEQRRDVLAASSLDYARKLEQARLDSEMSRERITNVNIFQPPTFVAKPVTPNKLLILLAGCVFAFCASIATVLALEFGPPLLATLRTRSASSLANTEFDSTEVVAAGQPVPARSIEPREVIDDSTNFRTKIKPSQRPQPAERNPAVAGVAPGELERVTGSVRSDVDPHGVHVLADSSEEIETYSVDAQSAQTTFVANDRVRDSQVSSHTGPTASQKSSRLIEV